MLGKAFEIEAPARGFRIVNVFYSDDVGETWRFSPNNLWIWPLPSEGNVGGHSALYEPVTPVGRGWLSPIHGPPWRSLPAT